MRLNLNFRVAIGTDLVFTPRFLTLDTPNWRRFHRLSRRLLTDSEYELLTSLHGLKGTDGPPASAKRYHKIIKIRNFVAGRWAAKEAAMKAWGADLLSPQQLEVRLENGRPSIHCFLPDDAEAPEDKITSQEGNLSISHDGDYATATVIARPLHPDLRSAFVKIKTEARKKVAGKSKDETETDIEADEDENERDFFPKSDPAFDNIVDLSRP